MASGLFCNQTSVASSVVSRMDMEPVPAELIENGPASGASAVKVAYMAIASGMADVVMVVGGEIMRKVSGWQATDIVATMLHTEAEYNMGLTLPSFGGIAVKLDGVLSHQDATTKNPLAGQTGWNYFDRRSFRAAARWKPLDGLTDDFSYDVGYDANTPFYSQLLNYNPNAAPNIAAA